MMIFYACSTLQVRIFLKKKKLVVLSTVVEIHLLRRFLTKQNKTTVSNITAAIKLMRMKTALVFPNAPFLFHPTATSKQTDINYFKLLYTDTFLPFLPKNVLEPSIICRIDIYIYITHLFPVCTYVEILSRVHVNPCI